jgi:hypothetical protein
MGGRLSRFPKNIFVITRFMRVIHLPFKKDGLPGQAGQ